MGMSILVPRLEGGRMIQRDWRPRIMGYVPEDSSSSELVRVVYYNETTSSSSGTPPPCSASEDTRRLLPGMATEADLLEWKKQTDEQIERLLEWKKQTDEQIERQRQFFELLNTTTTTNAFILIGGMALRKPVNETECRRGILAQLPTHGYHVFSSIDSLSREYINILIRLKCESQFHYRRMNDRRFQADLEIFESSMTIVLAGSVSVPHWMDNIRGALSESLDLLLE